MGAFAAALLALLGIAFAGRFAPTPADNYVVLADAFLHGHAWVTLPAHRIDALLYNGKYYVIEGPFPALLLLPVVALFGRDANQTVLGALLASLSIGIAWELCRKLGASLWTRFWLCGFFLLGTDLFWCAMLGDVWFIAHLSAVAFTLSALNEVLGKRRAWLVALLAVCAAESRFPLVLALPVYLVLLVRGAPPEKRGRAVLAFAGVIVPLALVAVGYNEARWHLPYDIGYTVWYHRDPIGRPTGSPFGFRFLLDEWYSFFVLPPIRTAVFPYVIPNWVGLALPWTSPALALAFFARGPRLLIGAMWCAVVLLAVPNLLYYANGFAQFGMRHALDFEPFLFVLMILAVRPRISALGAALCTYSMLVGLWGVWYWRTFYRLF